MILYAARRLGWALFTALIASIAAFALFWAIPNVDPEYWLGGAEKGNDATPPGRSSNTASTTRCPCSTRGSG